MFTSIFPARHFGTRAYGPSDITHRRLYSMGPLEVATVPLAPYLSPLRFFLFVYEFGYEFVRAMLQSDDWVD